MINKFNSTVVAPGFRLKRGSTTLQSGNTLKYIAQAVFNPSANTGERTVAAHGLGVYLPPKAIITNVWWDVITTFTSASSDTGTIALSAESADDLVAAVAISTAGDVWDAGIHAGKIGYPSMGADAAHDSQAEVAALFAATYLKLTVEREIVATVAVAALTAGKAVFYVEYVIGA